jgi:hypothetical protein
MSRQNPRRSRGPYGNVAEATFVEKATEAGWSTCKRGWPDFTCWKDGRMVAVEVKPTKNCWLKRDQEIVMRELARSGVECFIWSPDVGFRRINDRLQRPALSLVS